MRVSRNLAAGLANSMWTAVIGLWVVPLYLRYLGLEAYGLIGFFITAQAMLLLLDLGLTPTINREVAKAAAASDLSGARTLLHTMAGLYWGTAILLAVLAISLSSGIASRWLQASSLPIESLTRAVMLMGLVIACRWPVALYQGVLMGMERMVTASAIAMAVVTVGNLGAIFVLAYLSPTIEAFFLWQAGVAVVHVLVMRAAAWRMIGRGAVATRFDANALRKVWRFSAGMSGVAFASILLTQLDKVLLSRLISLEDFGRYTLAGVVAGAFAVFIVPAFNLIYPRYTALMARGNMIELERNYIQGTQVFCAVLFPVAAMVVMFATDLLHAWTGNPVLASSVAPIAALLVMGSVLNGVMHFPYALQLAAGAVRLPLILSSGLTLLLIPLLVWLTTSYGAEGGAAAWLILNVVYLFAGAWLTHRTLLPGLAPQWLLKSVLVPLVLAVTVVYLGKLWIDSNSDWTHWARLIAAAMVTMLALGVEAGFSPGLRPRFGKKPVQERLQQS